MKAESESKIEMHWFGVGEFGDRMIKKLKKEEFGSDTLSILKAVFPEESKEIVPEGDVAIIVLGTKDRADYYAAETLVVASKCAGMLTFVFAGCETDSKGMEILAEKSDVVFNLCGTNDKLFAEYILCFERMIHDVSETMNVEYSDLKAAFANKHRGYFEIGTFRDMGEATNVIDKILSAAPSSYDVHNAESVVVNVTGRGGITDLMTIQDHIRKRCNEDSNLLLYSNRGEDLTGYSIMMAFAGEI